jgi:hypothetical protein
MSQVQCRIRLLVHLGLGFFTLGILLAACATSVKPGDGTLAPSIRFQSNELNPSNGGQLIAAEALRPGDILLTADNGFNSAGIRLITQSPVSHAVLYLGDQEVAEAVGEGIRRRSVADLLADEVTIVAFRHPNITPEHMVKMQAFVAKHLGQKYNFTGIMLQSPFVIERRVCELPLVPSLVRDFCIRGIAAVQLGLGRSDQFFCSQFVLEAYRLAGLALTNADPRLISPADLLHMREGDVPSVKIHQALLYVGHMKVPPEPVAINKTTP